MLKYIKQLTIVLLCTPNAVNAWEKWFMGIDPCEDDPNDKPCVDHFEFVSGFYKNMDEVEAKGGLSDEKKGFIEYHRNF